MPTSVAVLAGPRRERLAGLDGIQRLAALFVVINHVFLRAFPGYPVRIEFPGVKGFSSYSLKYMHAFAATWNDGPVVQGGLAQLCPSPPWTNQLLSPAISSACCGPARLTSLAMWAGSSTVISPSRARL